MLPKVPGFGRRAKADAGHGDGYSGLCQTGSGAPCVLAGRISNQTTEITKLGSLYVDVQSLSCIRLFETPWTAAHQAYLSSTISWSLLKLMSIESVIPSNHLILCCPLLLLSSVFPGIRIFPNNSFYIPLANFCGVNTPTVENGKLSVVSQVAL